MQPPNTCVHETRIQNILHCISKYGLGRFMQYFTFNFNEKPASRGWAVFLWWAVSGLGRWEKQKKEITIGCKTQNEKPISHLHTPSVQKQQLQKQSRNIYKWFFNKPKKYSNVKEIPPSIYTYTGTSQLARAIISGGHPPKTRYGDSPGTKCLQDVLYTDN